MAAGRPTTYSAEMQSKADEYAETYKDCGDVIPMIEGLALHLGVARKTIYNWAEDETRKELLHTLEKIEETQKKELFNNGLSGVFNSNITKLILTNHGMTDKVQQDMTSGGKQINQWAVLPVTTSKND